jgi:lipopolysaccharide export system permease protein
MRIIDRYLLRQYLQTFLICYLSLMGLYVVFDAFTNLEEFLRCGEKSGGLLTLMGSFYAYQSIAFFDRTSGLLALISAMFTIAWIQRHNEMTALMAAGIHRVRVVKPVIAAAVVISVLATVNRELVIPRFTKQLSRQPQDLIGDVAQELQPRWDAQTNILIQGKATFAVNQRIEEPVFVLPRKLNHYAKQITAKDAYYRPPDAAHPGGYLVEGLQEPKNLGTRPSLVDDGKPVIITALDAPDWLQPQQCFVVSNMTFDELTAGRTFVQFASTGQLISGLRNPSLNFEADMRVAIHSRMVQPLLDITLVFLGLPLVVTRNNRNIFVAVGLCLGVVTVFLMVVIALQYMGSIGLIPPAFAAWAPLMLFVPAAVALAEGMWK